MNLALALYLVNVSGSLHAVAWGLFWLTAIGFGISSFIIAAMCAEPCTESAKQTAKSFAKKVYGKWWVLMLFFIGAAFLPSKQTSYQILAAYGVQKVAENPNVQAIAGSSLKLLEKTISKYLEEEEQPKKSDSK